jgi:hypothetical protein
LTLVCMFFVLKALIVIRDVHQGKVILDFRTHRGVLNH